MDPAQSPKDGDASRPTTASGTSPARSRQSSMLRRASVSLMEANPPLGMWQATGDAIAKAPSLGDIRRGSFGSSGWTTDPVREGERRRSISVSSSAAGGGGRRVSGATADVPLGERLPPPSLPSPREETPPELAKEEETDGISAQPDPPSPNRTRIPKPPTTINEEDLTAAPAANEKDTARSSPSTTAGDAEDVPPNPNNYIPPPVHSWPEATVIALKAFWRFSLTPSGFLITLYCLNVVAWGGMLFLLLINAAPAMCHPLCKDINSPRRKWIEVDSQILNALFCVTGFGLIPWRFRDCYYLLRWRLGGRVDALRTLAGIHRGWFRLAGSDRLDASPDTEFTPATLEEHPSPSALANPALPLPLSRTPDPPLTGVRAPPTPPWKLDFVILMFVLNTFLQVVLSTFMWGFNRYKRPNWSTGLFVALACIVAAAAGVMSAVEGRKVKRVEGVPWGEEDLRKYGMRADEEGGGGGDGDAEKEKEKEKDELAIVH